jgi:hypothetical protein
MFEIKGAKIKGALVEPDDDGWISKKRSEQHTMLYWNAADDTLRVYSSDPAWIRRLLALGFEPRVEKLPAFYSVGRVKQVRVVTLDQVESEKRNKRRAVAKQDPEEAIDADSAHTSVQAQGEIVRLGAS